MSVGVKEMYLELERETDAKGKIEILNKLAFHFLNADPEKCQAIADQIMDISQKINYPEGMATARMVIARVAAREPQFELAERLFNEALSYLDATVDLVLKAKIEDGLAIVYSAKGAFAESIEHDLKAIELFDKVDEPLGLKANCMNNLGNTYVRMGDRERAEVYYRKALEVLRETGNEKHGTNIRANLAILLLNKKAYEESHEQLTQCLHEFEANDHKRGIISAHLNLGHACSFLNRYADAVSHYRKAIVGLRNFNHHQALAEAYLGLGRVYLGLGGLKEAMQQIEKSEAVHQTMDYPNGKIELLKVKAKILEKNGQLQAATKVLDQAIALAESLGLDPADDKIVY